MNLRVAGAIALIIGSIACTSKLDSSPSSEDELNPRNSPLAVGEMAPDFTLEDQNNRKVTLSSARGRPTVLIFYRGNW